jgi:uncharacterized protein with von Willebrand factor type A (vWA) domain
VILGDGRNNVKDPKTRALKELVEHTKQTIWIEPEPKWGWTLGSCDLPLYQPTCNRVWLVRTVDQLAGVAEVLDESRV